MNAHTSSPRFARIAAALLGLGLLFGPAPALAAQSITFSFNGGGWGHGIGLSQYGAQGFATRKTDPMTYDEILAHYYKGTRLVVPSSNANPTVHVNLASNSAARNAWQVASADGTTLTIESVSDGKNEILLPGSKTYWVKTVSGSPNVYEDSTYVDAGTTKHRPGKLKKAFPKSYRLESSSTRVSHSSAWTSTTSSSASGGSYLKCAKVGEQMSLKFEGTSLGLVGANAGGRGEIRLDGESKARATLDSAHPTFLVDKLPSGTHTVTIKVVSGTVAVDAFDLFEGVRVTSGPRVMLVSTSGPYDRTSMRWRGNVHIVAYTNDSAKAINHVSLENYLLGVVPAESSASWHSEALKAQAVAARSYAYQDAKNGQAIWCTTMSQMYAGESRGSTVYEKPTTTAAVKDTRGQLVWYRDETQPVKTFFFSSSGGYTASVEDVWGSAPKEYYTGVPDADQASSNYKWTLGPLSAQTVSDKIRAATSSAAASPATVIAISVDRATSGYVKTAKVRWSNGTAYTLKGDLMRSALSMKSSKFNPLARIEAPGSSWDSSGTWQTSYVGATSTRIGSSGGSHYVSRTPGAYKQIRFWGTSVSWIGAKYAGYGTAEVWIDGVYKKTVDLYSAKTLYQQKLYTATGLSASTTHTLKIKVTGKKNAAATGAWVGVDAADVTGGGIAPK